MAADKGDKSGEWFKTIKAVKDAKLELKNYYSKMCLLALKRS